MKYISIIITNLIFNSSNLKIKILESAFIYFVLLFLVYSLLYIKIIIYEKIFLQFITLIAKFIYNFDIISLFSKNKFL